MTLGIKIKTLRNQKGITQKELAEKLNVSFQTISKWENDDNEPDVATLKELSKIFGCSLDSLLDNEPVNAVISKQAEPVTKTIVVHQKEMHVCEYCKKDIPDNDLEMEQVQTSARHRGHHATYRTAYYHKNCLAALRKKRKEDAEKVRTAKANKARKYTIGWSVFGAIVTFVISMLCLFLIPQCQENVHPALAVFLSFLFTYMIFSAIYCVISGSWVADVFEWCMTRTVRFPGIIFSFDMDGFTFLVAMKVLFAILGFMIGLFFLAAGITLTGFFGGISLPFVIVKNKRTMYEDSLID